MTVRMRTVLVMVVAVLGIAGCSSMNTETPRKKFEQIDYMPGWHDRLMEMRYG